MLTNLKLKVFSALAALGLLIGPALAAGTLPLAMAQQIDINGRPLAGCQVYFFAAGTPSSPQNAFADFGLSQSLGPQIACDQTGRVPMFWLADGLIHVRLVDATGLTQIDTTMQVLGPSSGGGGGGGGGTVDPTTVLATGDLKAKYGIGPITGFVRANGLTIGNATSGASERANADTQTLFIYLYGADSNLVVSGGRTGNALNDYNASKTIALPDWSGRALAGLDDMGAGPRGRLTATYFGTSATVLGAAGGSQSVTIATTNLPPYTPSGSVFTGISGGGNVIITDGVNFPISSGGLNPRPQAVTNITASSSFSGNPQGGASTPFSLLQPTMLATIYIKL